MLLRKEDSAIDHAHSLPWEWDSHNFLNLRLPRYENSAEVLNLGFLCSCCTK